MAAFREFFPGMGEAVAKRTILRRVADITQPVQTHTLTFDSLLCGREDLTLMKWLADNDLAMQSSDDSSWTKETDEGSFQVTLKAYPARDETWGEVADRVAIGNASLVQNLRGRTTLKELWEHELSEYALLKKHISSGGLPMSGRHLQHGDASQIDRRLELFSNCSTATLSSFEFFLLLSGSGVGTDYSDHMQIIDWSKNLPIVEPVIASDHPDAVLGLIKSWTLEKAQRFYANRKVTVFTVPDSREGWRQALEMIESMTFVGTHHQEVLLLDFSKVRSKGTPIAGMQGRPSSGPADLMVAIYNIAKLRDSGMAPWRATCHVDHYLAECVLVGGARRAARMAVKYWKDPDILEFIGLKQTCDLWSANNSVLVDEEFWNYAAMSREEAVRTLTFSDYATWQIAGDVRNAVTQHSYFDKTGEPGLINVDKLEWRDDGLETLTPENLITDDTVLPATRELMKAKLAAWLSGKYRVIVNPCAEILLSSLGGFCVIADLAPYLSNFGLDPNLPLHEYHALWDAAVIESAEVATRALIRVNTLPSIYGGEVTRTNRIGVSLTGIHEYALARFGHTFEELLNAEESSEFWTFIARLSTAVQDAAEAYCTQHGLSVPHTSLTIKPSGCMIPETVIRTNRGNKTLAQIFEANGYNLSSLEMERDKFLPLSMVPFSVFDENNQEQSITALYVNGTHSVVQLNFDDQSTEWCTPNHRFKTTNRGWVPANELTPQDTVVRHEHGGQPVQLLIPPIQEMPRFTVDIEVANTHSYQLSTGVVVHNTISKLWGLTEGANLASRRHYLRWVQFRTDSDRLPEFRNAGYPTRDLKTYTNTTIVGFPTEPLLYSLHGSENYITADEATPEQHYQWLRNLEKYWINGRLLEDGTVVHSGRGNQVSYTLKYDPAKVSYGEFCRTLSEHQPTIRCCSVLPHVDLAYEYTPEQSITRAEYERILDSVSLPEGAKVQEDIDKVHVDCEGGACPVDFNKEAAA